MLLFIFGLSFIFVEQVDGDDLVILGKGNSPIYVSNSDSGRFDFSNDGLADYYVKAHYTGNENQQYKVDYKIQDTCVDGNTFSTATMKIGFTTKSVPNERIWLTENMEVKNPWFNSPKNDKNRSIDLVMLPKGSSPTPYPSDGNGDDVIQGSEKQGSFIHKGSIRELDNQSGWEGSIFFNVPSGEYYLWTIHPAEGTVGCDTLAGLGIPIMINE